MHIINFTAIMYDINNLLVSMYLVAFVHLPGLK